MSGDLARSRRTCPADSMVDSSSDLVRSKRMCLAIWFDQGRYVWPVLSRTIRLACSIGVMSGDLA